MSTTKAPSEVFTPYCDSTSGSTDPTSLVLTPRNAESGVTVPWPCLISSISGLIESMAMAKPMFWAVSMMAVLMATT